ncbi:uncharacterized protein JCM6883_000564 [Sporobolomyces salmoneus]|uniref:uncharacterized protein n=1 Tax=Sporobolomyces salmoneus TaxID=183962 RepID=UPI00317DB1E3
MSTDWHSLESALSHADNDKRIQALHSVRSLLEQHDTASTLSDPEALADTLKSSLKSNNSHVSNATLPVLSLYFDLLSSKHSSASTLKHALITLLPGILEKLGDAKLPTRESAREAFVSAARANLVLGIQTTSTTTREKDLPIWNLVENGLREHGFYSKNAKAREQALLALLAIRTPSTTSDYPLPPLKPFTPLLLPLLADSDPSVRSTALSTTISIFSAPSVTTAAKTDLKKAMAKVELPKKVQDQVIQSVLVVGQSLERSPSQTTTSSNGQTTTPPSSTILAGPATRTRTRAAQNSSSSSSTTSVPTSLPAAAFPSDPSSVHNGSSVEPVYLASISDLRTEFERMKPCFEGKETEHNWIERDKSIAIVRGIIEGGVCRADGEGEEGMREEFVKCVKEIQEGIIKTSSSLRTTLAISSLTLLTSLSTSLPSHLVDQLVDPFLPHCLSMSSQTKKIVATASQQTVRSFLLHSSYQHKTTQLLLSGISDKVVSSRQYISSHLTTFLEAHSASPRTVQAMDSTGGTNDLVEAIKRGLADPNKEVRENSRDAYWRFEGVWKERAEREIREGLDAGQKKLLDKAKPAEGTIENGATEKVAVAQGGTRRAGPTTVKGKGKETGGGSAKKPSVRELMLAAKRKKLAEEAEAEAQAQSQGQAQSNEADDHLPEEISPSKPPKASTSPAPVSTPQRPRSSISSNSSGGSLTQQQRHEAYASPSLQEVSSPFSAPLSYETPSRPPPASSNRRSVAVSSTPLNLPVVEPVVDESLKEQAAQAEQTVERLLEITQEEEEEQRNNGTGTERVVTTPGRPVEKQTGSSLNGTKRESEVQQQTPVNGGKLLFGRRQGGMRDVFQDSPDLRDGMGGGARGDWWKRKAENVGLPSKPLPKDSEARTDEINELVEAMGGLEVEMNDLKQLSALSRERPVRESDEEGETTSVVEGEMTAGRWWKEGRRFSRVYEGVKKQLLGSDQGTNRDMALIVLRDLVENQFPCFAGEESGVFKVLLMLREDPSRTTIAATETIATSFVSRLEPLYGLGTLCPSLETYLATTTATPDNRARSFGLGLKLVGTLFELLPAEVLEDVFPQSKELIKRALNDQSSGDLRRAAINALVSAQSVLRDEKRLTEMMDGLASDQANLLSYYCAKRGV